jgi:tRNA dimethylallyltransferase
MAVYRGMDIGTAKPTPVERQGVQVHMIDVVDPCVDYTVTDFQSAARMVLESISGRGRRALLVGGTGLYLRALVDDLRFPGRWPDVAASLEEEADVVGAEHLHARLAHLDPSAASRIEPSNRRRIVRALEVTIGSGSPFSSFGPGLTTYAPSPITQIGIPYVASIHDDRIGTRFADLMGRGFLDEVRSLSSSAQGMSRTARQGIGYRELLEHVEQGAPYAEAVDKAIRRTRVLARRQWSWFKRDPRIDWLDPEADLLVQISGRADRQPHSPVGD